ncbi:MAG TPA: ATP-dependent Clp protease ATP-binding subunit [Anaerolineales bacterium]|nr:ATP-dependent Clp protease ATP-binding subunit [Anaerolineales bacterium]
MSDNMQRFTQRARRVMVIANEEAQELRQSHIGTEHLLLGLIKEEGGVSGRVLRDLGLDYQKLRQIVERLNAGTTSESKKMELSPSTKQVLKAAMEEARRMSHHYIGTEHLLLGLMRQEDGVALDVLRRLDITPEQIRRQTRRVLRESASTDEENTAKDDPVASAPSAPAVTPSSSSRTSRAASSSSAEKKSNTPLVDQLATDLTKLAEEGKLDPVIGRQNEIERVIQILARRTKNNPALIGEPGVGKTAIVEGLAQRIVEGSCPEPLLGKRVLQLDVGSLVAGTMYRGQFEERLKRVIEELKKSDAILFIDEVHMLVGAGSAGSSVDAANILKPALSRGELQVIGATTFNEYRKNIESDAALERRFQPITVDEPSPAEAVQILRGIRERYEDHHKLQISDEALEAAVNLSSRYVTDRFLPDKAIDLIDESSSRVRMYKNPLARRIQNAIQDLRIAKQTHEKAVKAGHYEDTEELRNRVLDLEDELEELRASWDRESSPLVTAQDIAEVVSMLTGVPVVQISESESSRLLQMESTLHERVIGQEEAISAISKAVRRARAGLKDPNRPIGSFIFLGPTGVGKTELSKALASFLFGTEEALVQIDMSEFMERHNISRLVGAPPGYVGYDEAGQLTETIRRRPYSVIVFDEVEKAHPETHNMLLQILEEGHLTDGRGKKVDFRNTLIVMTSNIGASLIKRQGGLGFQLAMDQTQAEANAYDAMKKKLTDELKRYFRPEFLNRLDGAIVFHPLNQAQIIQIVDLELEKVSKRLQERGLRLSVSTAAKEFLGKQGYDPDYGARPLRRIIQQYVEDGLSDTLLTAGEANGIIFVDYSEEQGIQFRFDMQKTEEAPMLDAVPS